MFTVILHEPEIAPNVGNIIRLCANAGAQLHLIEPLGFEIDNKRMRRAGLDYHEFVDMQIHRNWEAYLTKEQPDLTRVFALTSRGTRAPSELAFRAGDIFLFGSETRGLPVWLRESLAEEQRLRLPMCPGNRSLNLSNAVAITVFEAWRQCDFAGSAPFNPELSGPGKTHLAS